MKVIDLLQRIANGEEVPEKIQVYSDIFVLDCGNMVYEHEKTRTNLLSIYNGNILNYEVKIKEEDKKIKKLEHWVDVKSWVEGDDLEKGLEEQSEFNKNIYYKVNEIIDVLNEMREDK